MAETDEPIRMLVRIAGGPDSDAEEVEGLTRRLRQELLENEADSVDHVRAAAAAGFGDEPGRN